VQVSCEYGHMSDVVDAVRASERESATDLPGGAFTEWGPKEWPCPTCGEKYALAVESGNMFLEWPHQVQKQFEALVVALKAECPAGHPTGHLRSDGKSVWPV
jgi:hypothetical protein